MLKFNFAREALIYLINRYEIKEIFIPYYLCDVIRHSVFETGCKPLFYHIDDTFMPNIDFSEDSYIVYPNYFGICSKNIDKLVEKYPKLIVDNAHAFYAQPQGFATFNSSRKFLSQNEGSFLWIGNDINCYKPDFKRRKIFDKLDDTYKKSNNLKISLKKDDIPFCYPYLAKTEKEADELVKNLKEQGKTIYRYWNNLPQNYNEYKFYSKLVPIPLI